MPPTFYIIDGHAQIFRAYFAPFRDLTSPDGQPVKAVYAFVQTLLNLAARQRPDYLAMAVDTGHEQVFRRTIYPEYKAHRPPPPPDFHPQEQRILQLVRDAGVPIVAQVGFEADDLMATMARRLAAAGMDVVLVSKDKDLRQVLADRIRMFDAQKETFLTAESLERELGFTPAQAIDVQTLMGDATDNVPGIPGVGEKTAARLIRQYGSVAGVLAHLDELTPRLRENFQKHAGELETSRQLVTLRTDVPLDFDPARCLFRGFNRAGLEKHFRELGFHSLLPRLSGIVAPESARAVQPRRAAQAADDTEPGLFGPVEPDTPAAGGAGSLPADAGPPLADSASCDYRLVNTPAALEAFLAELRRQPRFAFDTETEGLGALSADLVGMSFSWQAGTGWYLPVRGPADATVLDRASTLQTLRPILQDPAIAKLGQNIKYDLLVMRTAGVELRGIVMDTMIAAFLLDPGRSSHGIDALARDLLRFRKIATTDLIGRGRRQITMAQVPLERICRYAAEDADIAWRLAELLGGKLDQVPSLRKLHDELEIPLLGVLADMEHRGVAIDTAMLQEQSRILAERAAALREQIVAAAGCPFNPDSPRQLADILFGRMGLKPPRRIKTGLSTDADALERLCVDYPNQPLPRLMLRYRMLVKLINTYLDNLPHHLNPRTGRLHGSFSQVDAETGRLAMSDPNLQNIPIRTDEGSRIRLAFVPGDRQRQVLLTADYSQIELRVLAHFTREPALLAAFASDQDIHRAVAAEVFGVTPDQVSREQRAQAKVINFGIIYGISAYGLAQRIEGLSVPAARQLIKAYDQRFPAINRFMQQCVEEALSQGYVTTILGRRRAIPSLTSGVLAQRRAGERMAINTVIQGSAADLIKQAMLNIHRRAAAEGWQSRMLLQVHDELVFETPRDVVQVEAEAIRREMTSALALAVPLKVDIGWGENWQAGKR
jgi:DNA polymerase-1